MILLLMLGWVRKLCFALFTNTSLTINASCVFYSIKYLIYGY